MSEYKTDKLRESAEKIWDVTRKTLQTAGLRANQYKEIVQKKIDLNNLHKNISSLHEDLGKIVDLCRSSEEDTPILAREDIRAIFRRLDSYKSAADAIEAEIEKIKAKMDSETTETGKE